MTIVIAAQYSVALKHQFDKDYKPKFIINEPEVYVIGAMGGSIGLLISYIGYKEIRMDDSFNRHRFLWISLGFLALQSLIIILLSYYHVIVYQIE